MFTSILAPLLVEFLKHRIGLARSLAPSDKQVSERPLVGGGLQAVEQAGTR